MKFYPLTLDDGGRNLSRRPHQANDCCVRALTIVTGLLYDTVYDELSRAGRRSHDGFDLTSYLARRRTFLGHKFISTRFRRQILISDVFKTYKRGRHVVDLNDHVFALINGCAYDLVRVKPTTQVLGIWTFTS